MRSTLKRLVLAMVLALIFIGFTAFTLAEALDNQGDPDGALKGSVTLSVAEKNIDTATSFYRLGFDDSQSLLDCRLGLPIGFSLQTKWFAGLNDENLDSDRGDEFDVAIGKKFRLSPETYLKFRVEYADIYPTCEADSFDVMRYDVFLGHTVKLGDLIKMTAELQADYWYFIRNSKNSMVSIIPSLAFEYKVSNRFTFYDQILLQWNEEMWPYYELLSGQTKAGIKAELSQGLTWKMIEVCDVRPLTPVDRGDFRYEYEDITCSTALTYNF